MHLFFAVFDGYKTSMKIFITFCLIFIIAAPVAAQHNQNHYISMAEDWLSNLGMAQTPFRQIDYQGQELRGMFYINRPGRLRFEYQAPIKDHIVADGTFIYFHDGETGQANSAPIGLTLADFILRKDVKMSGKIKVESVREKTNSVKIVISQSDQPGSGELVLSFTKEPFTLKGWKIIDAQGLTTDIILDNLQEKVKLDPRLFVYKHAQSQERFNQ